MADKHKTTDHRSKEPTELQVLQNRGLIALLLQEIREKEHISASAVSIYQKACQVLKTRPDYQTALQTIIFAYRDLGYNNTFNKANLLVLEMRKTEPDVLDSITETILSNKNPRLPIKTNTPSGGNRRETRPSSSRRSSSSHSHQTSRNKSRDNPIPQTSRSSTMQTSRDSTPPRKTTHKLETFTHFGEVSSMHIQPPLERVDTSYIKNNIGVLFSFPKDSWENTEKQG